MASTVNRHEGGKDGKRRGWLPFPLWPRSLAGQLLAALLIALLIAQAITILIFAHERSSVAVNTTRGQVLERTASVVRVLNQTDEGLHRRVIRAAEGPGILYSIREQTTLLVPRTGTMEAMLTARLERRAGLASGTVRINNVTNLTFLGRRRDARAEDQEQDWDDNSSPPPPPKMSWEERREAIRQWRENGRKGPHPFGRGGKRSDRDSDRDRDRDRDRRPNLAALDMTLAVPLDNGKWLQVRTGVPSPPTKWGQPFLISLGVTASFILLVVIVTVRKLTAPLRELEQASRKLGRGEAIEPLAERGPHEVRNTIVAFNAMQDRLMRFVQDRTRMLAAVSHDLRTPITTMRLRAEFIDDDEMREKLLETLEEMQTMTDAVLAFAREDASREETRETDISALLSSMVEDYQDMGKDVDFSGPDHFIYACRAVSLKRAVRNLTENALRYGGNAAILLEGRGHSVTITISDTGPGIPEDKLDDVFAPFFRVEGSRNPGNRWCWPGPVDHTDDHPQPWRRCDARQSQRRRACCKDHPAQIAAAQDTGCSPQQALRSCSAPLVIMLL